MQLWRALLTIYIYKNVSDSKNLEPNLAVQQVAILRIFLQ